MSMEEFADFTERRKEEPLAEEEIQELDNEFQEENFTLEDFLPSDWYLF